MAFEDTHGSPLVLSFQTFAVLVGLSLAKPLFGPRPNLSLAQGMRGEDLDDVLTFFPMGGQLPPPVHSMLAMTATMMLAGLPTSCNTMVPQRCRKGAAKAPQSCRKAAARLPHGVPK